MPLPRSAVTMPGGRPRPKSTRPAGQYAKGGALWPLDRCSFWSWGSTTPRSVVSHRADRDHCWLPAWQRWPGEAVRSSASAPAVQGWGAPKRAGQHGFLYASRRRPWCASTGPGMVLDAWRSLGWRLGMAAGQPVTGEVKCSLDVQLSGLFQPSCCRLLTIGSQRLAAAKHNVTYQAPA